VSVAVLTRRHCSEAELAVRLSSRPAPLLGLTDMSGIAKRGRLPEQVLHICIYVHEITGGGIHEKIENLLGT